MVNRTWTMKGLFATAMYYLPIPLALHLAMPLVPMPSTKGWSILYYDYGSRDYWIVYAVLLGWLWIVPWLMGNPLKRGAFRGWWDFLVHMAWGYAIAVGLTLGWLLILGTPHLRSPQPLDGELVVFAMLTLLYIPPPWAPVIAALLVSRRGSKEHDAASSQDSPQRRVSPT